MPHRTTKGQMSSLARERPLCAVASFRIFPSLIVGRPRVPRSETQRRIRKSKAATSTTPAKVEAPTSSALMTEPMLELPTITVTSPAPHTETQVIFAPEAPFEYIEPQPTYHPHEEVELYLDGQIFMVPREYRDARSVEMRRQYNMNIFGKLREMISGEHRCPILERYGFYEN